MDGRYRRYLAAKLKLRDEAREAARRERVERILNSLPKLKRASEVKPPTFTEQAYIEATRAAQASANASTRLDRRPEDKCPQQASERP